MEQLTKGLELVAKRMIDPSSGAEFSVISAIAMAGPMDALDIATAVS